MENAILCMSLQAFAAFVAELDRAPQNAPELIEVISRVAPWEYSITSG